MHLLKFLLSLNKIFLFFFNLKIFLASNSFIPKSNRLYRHIMVLILAYIGKPKVKVDSAIKLRNALLKTLFESSNAAPYIFKALNNLVLFIIKWFYLLNDIFSIKIKKWRVLAHSEKLTLQVFIAIFVKITEV